jgi:hypothetical protein
MDQKAGSEESMVESLIAYSVVFMVLNVVIVALRYYVRLLVIRKFGNDDDTMWPSGQHWCVFP